MTLGFLIRHLLRLAVSLAVLVVASFAMIHLIPGDPLRQMLGPTAPKQLVDARRTELGLNDALPTQFLHYVQHVCSGDLGTSFFSSQPVSDIIAQGLPNTLALAVLATLVALLVAIPLGMWAGVRTHKGRRPGTETAFTTLTGAAVAIPEYLYGLALLLVFALGLGILPPAGLTGPSSYLLPVTALSIAPAAMIARLARVETQRELDTDYMRLAHAKRLPTWRMYAVHLLPNTLTATLTMGGLLLGGLITGSVLVENVFAWPGLGQRTVEAITQKDYPVAQAMILVYGALVLAVNFLVDIALGLLDPKSALSATARREG
ncbi:ABC transporter permease subunit [Streptomyces sp. SID8366]|uniref:ABC transporter permease n=1 Tax=unclassified Streptomyces TaxID=2593676 RepID=UPI000DBABABE|nr:MULTISPECIES: ABC transporter permease [unclassified Streptomyces]MYU06004.1 ABC transporter permease subunit [Streptomyces sp. SID8366]MYU64349.1 ABC transporter permease subunit [Streptomyces sp. SID69]RAJ64063.1 peptide/nickel transport system permease protein [Streptomyces sp. PsTaAH-130]